MKHGILISAIVFAIALICCFALLRFGLALIVGAVLVLLFGVYLIFDRTSSVSRGFAIMYLMFVGAEYLAAGILGLSRNGQVLASAMWVFLLARPFALINLIVSCTSVKPCGWIDLGDVIPPSQTVGWISFSLVVILFSLVAIAAAFAMLRRHKLGFQISLVLVTFLGISSVWDLADMMLQTRNSRPPAGIPWLGVLTMFWAASYVIAYVIARKRQQIE